MFDEWVFQSKIFYYLCCIIFNGSINNVRSLNSEPSYPWTFDNDLFGGPDFWGLVSKEWQMCRLGKLQSPINIDPSRLLFDPQLEKISMAHHPVEATLLNSGQLPILTIGQEDETNSSSTTQKKFQLPQLPVNISGGPSPPYNYQLHQMLFHFGRVPNSNSQWNPVEGSADFINNEQRFGSEHTIDKVRFAGEIQLLAFNSDLYKNFSEAMHQPRGLLAISVIVDIGETTNVELGRLTVASQSIVYKNQNTKIRKFHAANLLPKTENFVTYEGSLTYPGCYETVTWVVMNNPIYITIDDLKIWNNLQQREEKETNQVFMSANFRPLKPINGRMVRTNINFKYKTRAAMAGSCPSNIYLNMGYRSNARHGITDLGSPKNDPSQQKSNPIKSHQKHIKRELVPENNNIYEW